jgi:hypothetical protein
MKRKNSDILGSEDRKTNQRERNKKQKAESIRSQESSTGHDSSIKHYDEGKAMIVFWVVRIRISK